MTSERKGKEMKTQLLVIACSMVTAAGALIAGPSRAADESALAQRSGCLACHKGAENRIGPPYKDIAAKYAGQKNAAAALADRIVKGTGPDGVGWMAAGKATLPVMPPNGNVSPGNAMKLANWVLGIKGEIASSTRFVTEKMTVAGLVKNPLTLTVDDLRRFPPQYVGELPIVCQSGANLGKLENLGGILLKNILDKAGIVSRSHNDVKETLNKSHHS
jgi:cytochrome c